MDKAADRLPLSKKAAYDKARKDAEGVYSTAKDYLEKAHSMYAKPNKDNLYWLKVVYTRLKDSKNRMRIIEEEKSLN